jgi:hypothetical protein
MNSGMIGASASITFCDDWRVAIFGASLAIAVFSAFTVLGEISRQFAGDHAVMLGALLRMRIVALGPRR